MFVPRALRLKGGKEQKKTPNAPPARRPPVKEANQALEATSPPPNSDNKSSAHELKPKSGPQFTNPTVTPEYLGWLLCGIELIFTDYAHQDTDGAAWLEKHSRDVDGQSKFIHLTAILEHPNISSLKPAANQIFLQQALKEQSSFYLELSSNGYYVRRHPSTYPLHFIPINSFSVVDDNGVQYWDQRTMYVEPHTRDLCKTPAKVAYWLKEHCNLHQKWQPIQAVQTLYNSCAFVILSGNITHGYWAKWRKPGFWKVMTKIEHTERTNEYVALLEKEKRERSKKSNNKSESTSDHTKRTTNANAEQSSSILQSFISPAGMNSATTKLTTGSWTESKTSKKKYREQCDEPNVREQAEHGLDHPRIPIIIPSEGDVVGNLPSRKKIKLLEHDKPTMPATQPPKSPKTGTRKITFED